ncbi:hypothetical protein FD755_009676 [Muntiacus reevesi]|uniref:RNA helicase n=1 Tax=Muntiacus reevesi TaxID=9886 RepID=A0A5N3XY35_MUNRE|nr:hypothetical protein FD755_009676 [Muntiacus reevesi]
MLKLKFQYFGHLMQRADSLEKTLMLGKIKSKRKRGQQRQWRTEKPSVLQVMGLSGVGHDLATEEHHHHSVRNPKSRNYTEPTGNKAKKVKKAGPSGVEVNSPKSKKAKNKEEPSQDDLISPKTESLKKLKEPCEKTAVSPNTKRVIKNEETSEDELGAPKPKKMRKEKEISGKNGEKSPNLKNHNQDFLIVDLTLDSKEVARKTVEQKGAFSRFPISEGMIKLLKTFHPVYSGEELIAQARTGTGKTFSFTVPLTVPQVLILAPTRELASQVSRDFSDITKKLALACFYGHIKDHLQNGKLDPTKLKHVVLDEVDQMLDMGFADQKDSEDNPQHCFFSATCPWWVYNKQVDLMGFYPSETENGSNCIVSGYQAPPDSQDSSYGDVIRVYSGYRGRTIMFCETKKETHELKQNVAVRQDAQSLYGDIPQKQREITRKGFRNGDLTVLVATNVAACRSDIPKADLVVQSSPPKDTEAGRTGVYICFYQHKEEYQLAQVFLLQGIIKASNKDAIRLMDSVSPTALDHFKQSTEKLTEEKGETEALAAALTHISSAMLVDQHSMINSDSGFVPMILQCSTEMPNISYAWKELKEQLSEDTDSKVKRDVQEKWHDSQHWQLSVATEQPGLEEPGKG